MPIIPSVLQGLIETAVDQNMASAGSGIASYDGPLSQQNPSYFIQMCGAIATGLAEGAPVIQFTSNDIGFTAAPPIPGVVEGVGIIVEPELLSQQMYTLARQGIIQEFGKTLHDPWPPGPGNLSGQMLRGLTDGVSSAIQQHFMTCWVLAGVDPLIYLGTGQVLGGGFQGIQASAVESAILAVSGQMATSQGWPVIVKAIAQAYQQNIESSATAQVKVVGVCIPGVAQICQLGPTASQGNGSAT